MEALNMSTVPLESKLTLTCVPFCVFRNYVISVLPQLKTMDFSGVTRDERVMADIWRSHGTKKTPRDH